MVDLKSCWGLEVFVTFSPLVHIWSYSFCSSCFPYNSKNQLCIFLVGYKWGNSRLKIWEALWKSFISILHTSTLSRTDTTSTFSEERNSGTSHKPPDWSATSSLQACEQRKDVQMASSFDFRMTIWTYKRTSRLVIYHGLNQQSLWPQQSKPYLSLIPAGLRCRLAFFSWGVAPSYCEPYAVYCTTDGRSHK